MNAATRFLRAVEHALTLRRRPQADSSVRRAADDDCVARAGDLLAEHPAPAFHFGSGGVRYGSLPLAGFESWPWAAPLVAQGIARLELVGPVSPAPLAAFLDLAAGTVPASAPVPRDGLRWTPVDLNLPVAGDDYPLDEELLVMRQLFIAAARDEPVRLGDATAIIAALGNTLTGGRSPSISLLQSAARPAYQPAHALNTALLAMAVADALQLGSEDRREAGLAALLHDIGMARLPAEARGELFSSQDRARVRGHPLEGARLLLRQGAPLETAAVVCYEHHLRQDGSGYPRLSYPREPHSLSRIIAVCDAFDALLAPRPDRPGREPAVALREIERSAVSQFDPRVVAAFSELVMRAAATGELAITHR